MEEKYDFGGYATKHNIRCSDDRVILPGAFKDQDGAIVPLVWHHTHDDPNNVLGHARLEYRDDGVYAYGVFNSTEMGQVAKELVKHGDIKSLSIYANKLVQKASDVVHGVIREVSLVLAGANPGAQILEFQHADGEIYYDETKTIFSFVLDDLVQDVVMHKEDEVKEDDMSEETTDETQTVDEILGTLNETQYDAVMALVGLALEQGGQDSLEQADDDDDADEEDDKVEDSDKEEDVVAHSDTKKGNEMKKNIFDQNGSDSEDTLVHVDTDVFFADAKRMGSMKEAALEHGITNVENWFPEAKTVGDTPANITRPMEWVAEVIGGVRRTPFSRIKSMAANLTADEARARGYIKGNKKTEEQVVALKRTTTPTTVYKLQKLDRDDVLDITDFDVVVWIKAEMRMMLDEEIARAFLVGDGRLASSNDKIKEDNVRPIWTDNDLYTVRETITISATSIASGELTDEENQALMDKLVRMRKAYKGSGNPVAFVGTNILCGFRLMRDGDGKRMFKTDAEIAADIRVSKIVEVGIFDGLTRTDGSDTLTLGAMIVNLRDYTVGADRGGEINFFEDFDIDYNQQAYLIETRISAALTQPYAALVLELKASA